jgi:hypothetical protein
VTARLGPPGSSEKLDGGTVDTWLWETRAPATPVPATRVSYAAGVPNIVDTVAYPVPGQIESCVLRVVANATGSITSTAWQGSRAGCYALSLKATAKQ